MANFASRTEKNLLLKERRARFAGFKSEIDNLSGILAREESTLLPILVGISTQCRVQNSSIVAGMLRLSRGLLAAILKQAFKFQLE